MGDVIVFALPETPEPDRLETDWWLVAAGEVVESGTGVEWIALSMPQESPNRRRVALAPVGSVRIDSAEPTPNLPERQAASVARVSALEMSMGEQEALHAASAVLGGRVVTAVVDRELMLSWLSWARDAGADPHHVVPIACLLKPQDDWTAADVGSQRLIGRAGMVMPAEPSIVQQLVGDAELRELTADEVDRAIVTAAEQPPLDLRTGKMTRRRTVAIDRGRIRELALLTALIPLIGLLVTLIGLAKIESATNRLNDDTLAIAERALGRPMALVSVEAELGQRAGGAVFGGATAPLTGLYSALQMEEGVSATELTYRADGTLSTTLAAPTLDPINRALVALQRNGHRITAVPRQATDGRTMVDVTVRSAL